jgi:hypothetical protein
VHGLHLRPDLGNLRVQRLDLPERLLQRRRDWNLRGLRLGVQLVVRHRRRNVRGVLIDAGVQQNDGGVRLRRDLLPDGLL